MCQKRLVTYRAVIYKIAVDAVIGKTTMKDLLSCNQNKEARLIEYLVLCRDHFQHLWHEHHGSKYKSCIYISCGVEELFLF